MKIIILDFSTAEVHIFPYDNEVWLDGEDFLADITKNNNYSFTEINCQWMIVNELNIQIH